jgi:hypothetical protein
MGQLISDHVIAPPGMLSSGTTRQDGGNEGVWYDEGWTIIYYGMGGKISLLERGKKKKMIGPAPWFNNNED